MNSVWNDVSPARQVALNPQKRYEIQASSTKRSQISSSR